ncbi:glycoside hydrolase family 53 protein [Globicatella sanguinis]|uniref:glycoside hydrolase family 53 protein n=1 Tax=Globicatella sanguinis TaxID=13076 RepID=UPI00082639F8|nr:glycosyl hydrolase 53 family protein [Globicatella sanguinis]
MKMNAKKLVFMLGTTLMIAMPNATVSAQEVDSNNQVISNQLINLESRTSIELAMEEKVDEDSKEVVRETNHEEVIVSTLIENIPPAEQPKDKKNEEVIEVLTENSMNEVEIIENNGVEDEDIAISSTEEKVNESSLDEERITENTLIETTANETPDGEESGETKGTDLEKDNKETTPAVTMKDEQISDELNDVLPTDFYVEKVEDLPDDFIKGVDISTLIAQEQSGVKYYDLNGKEVDLIDYLAQNSVNYIRIRVWNNPYDSDGNGYGGGNNDLEKAIEIGKRATEAGLNVLVDFHYSDFWADPGRQLAPKAWQEMTVDEKATALYEYTKDSLLKLKKAGVNVTMVQVGNETTGSGIAGEKGIEKYQLFKEGSRAIREIDPGIQIALHFTNPEKTDTILNFAKGLSDYAIDYDVFATSYYSYWHGKLENLTHVLQQISQDYNKKTLIAETSYAYTLEDGDGHGNVIGSTSDTDLGGYEATVQGQTNNIRDVIDAANKAGALGIFYWEPAWVPVGKPNWEQNLPIWEKYGSGWASSHAIEYDSNVTESTYGGSAWDNQALFDFNGKALPSIKVFELVNNGYGEVPEREIIEEPKEQFESLLDNPSFEEENLSSYTISEGYVSRLNDTPKDGEYALHFWSEQAIDFDVEQKVFLAPGTYQFNLLMQGDQTGQSENIYAFIKYPDGTLLTSTINLKGYANWQEANIDFTLKESTELIFGLHVTADAEAWGTTDNWLLKKTGDIAPNPVEEENEENPSEENPSEESTDEENSGDESSNESETTTDEGNIEKEQESSENDSNSESIVDSNLKPNTSTNNLIYSSMLPNTGSRKPVYLILLGYILLILGTFILLTKKSF